MVFGKRCQVFLVIRQIEKKFIGPKKFANMPWLHLFWFVSVGISTAMIAHFIF